ncbi:MAG TPA: hypothetical protein VKS60_13450 [Stellaceae bacterium]|nr:hypothetical protein [Stellaceae bacterium]
MSEFDDALAQIAAIRSQMARSVEFRGYGPATIAVTGGLAVLAAVGQGYFLADPAAHPLAYLGLWLGAAVVANVLGGIEMVTRSRRIHATLASEMLAMVVEQFMPSLAAGALLALVLYVYAPGSLWMLPGLWQLCFALGLFASCRFLPPGVFGIGVWYLASGLFCLAFEQGDRAFSPWSMGLPFGLGQAALAAILQWRLWGDNER